MKTPTTDKATARPWRTIGVLNKLARSQNCLVGFDDETEVIAHFYKQEFSDYAVRAVNEYAALVAVAEAADHLRQEMQNDFDEVPAGVDSWLATLKAKLSNLAAIRQNGGAE